MNNTLFLSRADQYEHESRKLQDQLQWAGGHLDDYGWEAPLECQMPLEGAVPTGFWVASNLMGRRKCSLLGQ
jgi:hypothetical protein